MKAGLAMILGLVLAGCESAPPFDYGEWLATPPRSILVLPPIDDTVETEATYGSLSALTVPIAERGYYVFPVAVVDSMMRQNGLPTPADMHGVSLAKIDEIFGADAVLYLSIDEWGTSYQVLQSVTTVSMVGRLVDVRSGAEIWRGEEAVSVGSGGGGNPIGILASALVTQVVRSIQDPSVDVARRAAWDLVHDDRHGFLPGPYDPDHESRLAGLREKPGAAN